MLFKNKNMLNATYKSNKLKTKLHIKNIKYNKLNEKNIILRNRFLFIVLPFFINKT